jgi:signal transduction histidine kinase
MEIKPKILIVDDKKENLIALRKVLQNLDIEIVEAASGNEALKATLHQNFALALLDIQMPDMDGYELAGILREEEKTARLPFIFISAVYTDNLNVFKGYEKGAFSFITKPFQPEILINKVNFFIDKHRQELDLIRLNLDLKNKNEELQQSNRELESFSYSVSHDLRAPIRAINGYSSILKEECSELMNTEAQELIVLIKQSAERMGLLIDQLLAFSRLGRSALTMSETDMNMVVDGAINEICRDHPQHREKITVDHLAVVNADATLFKQAWINLIENAIKYSSKKEHPEIRISCASDGNDVTFSISDNGAGFDMKYYHKLFNVFQRLHGEHEFAGTGVGLAIVHRIVTRHGGKVWADSKVDEGTTFSFSLPLLIHSDAS